MHRSKQSHHGHGGRDSHRVHDGHRPYWNRAHQDWRAWGIVLLMLVTMVIYLMSGDLAWSPDGHSQPLLDDSGSL
jgi:hypothetical protein